MISYDQNNLNIMRIYEKKSVMGSHDLTMFGGYWSSASGDIKHLVFQGLCNSMSRSSSLYVTTLLSVIAIGIVVVGI